MKWQVEVLRLTEAMLKERIEELRDEERETADAKRDAAQAATNNSIKRATWTATIFAGLYLITQVIQTLKLILHP